jgi:fatty-acyl-CoA synthase
MNSKESVSRSAYEYPLLIKNLFFAPIAYDPEREIVYKGGFRMSYATFRERVGRLASALIALGVEAGDTVAVMDYDSHRYLECYYAIPMIGAVLHTINVRLSSEQLVYTIDHAEDKVILVNSEMLPILEAIKGRIDTVNKLVLIDEGSGLPETQLRFAGEYEELLASSEPLAEFPELDEDARATTFYTTGTTGLPKGVYFSQRQLVLHTIASTAQLASNHAEGNFHREDVYMPLTPMFHVHAWGIPYIATYLGVKQVYPGKYVPAALLKLIAEEGVTFSHCVPTILAMLLKDPGSAHVDLSRWKCVIGGAALPKAVCAEGLRRGVDVFAGYGMSETCPVAALTSLGSEELKLPLEEQVALRVRTGRPIGMVQARVVDQAGKLVAADDKATGEIQVRAPWLTQGYHKDAVNSEKLWAGGWLHTQDLSAVDAAGSFRITDRLKDVVKVGGEWLSSLEIEDIIALHPSVAEAAVVGSADLKWGEIPLGIVVLKKDQVVSEHRVMEHVKGYIDRGVLPREAMLLKVKFVESIEKTGVGKVNKIALREKYAEKH